MGLPCSAWITEWVRSALSAGGFVVHDRVIRKPYASHNAFWLKPVSILGLFVVTTVNEHSPMLTIPLTLAPFRFDASRDALPSRLRHQSFDCGFIVPGASHRWITLAACPGRVLVVKHQARLWFLPYRAIIHATSRRTRIPTSTPTTSLSCSDVGSDMLISKETSK